MLSADTASDSWTIFTLVVDQGVLTHYADPVV
jgi:hypothetical protein